MGTEFPADRSYVDSEPSCEPSARAFDAAPGGDAPSVQHRAPPAGSSVDTSAASEPSSSYNWDRKERRRRERRKTREAARREERRGGARLDAPRAARARAQHHEGSGAGQPPGQESSALRSGHATATHFAALARHQRARVSAARRAAGRKARARRLRAPSVVDCQRQRFAHELHKLGRRHRAAARSSPLSDFGLSQILILFFSTEQKNENTTRVNAPPPPHLCLLLLERVAGAAVDFCSEKGLTPAHYLSLLSVNLSLELWHGACCERVSRR